MTRDALLALAAWLPVPVYRFVGGPFDGQERAVDLRETSYGMEAPHIWRVAEEPKFPQITIGPIADEIDLALRVHDYRFVRRPGSLNQGHYEHVA